MPTRFLAVLLALFSLSGVALASTYSTLALFTSLSQLPPEKLVIGADGNFYGVSTDSAFKSASVIKMTPTGTVTTVGNSGSIGQTPNPVMILASDGNFYGTTGLGGTFGKGDVFKLTPGGTLTSIYSFNTTGPAVSPSALIQAADGNLYGTTNFGGTLSLGTVFRITTGGSLTTLVNFGGTTNGKLASNGVTQAADGNFYGVTYGGGDNGFGTMFQLTPGGSFTSLHNFDYANGEFPATPLVEGNNGNFYGATNFGGRDGSGVIYRITTAGNQTPLVQLGELYGYSTFGLLKGSDGNFYGTARPLNAPEFGIFPAAMYELTPGGSITTLWNFPSDSSQSYALTQAGDGCLYGSTMKPSTSTGSVFRFNPASIESVTFATAQSVALSTKEFTISGSSLSLNVSFPPIEGAGLTVINNTGTDPINGTFSNLPDSGIITATYGGISYKFTANYEGGDGNDLVLIVGEAFDHWKAQPGFFTTAQLADPTISGPNATPQHDGYANILKYLFDINPARPMTAADRAALPTAAITNVSGMDYLTLTMRYNNSRTGILLSFQTSTDLVNWTTPVPIGLSSQIGTDPLTGDPIWRLGVKTNGVSQLYARLQATQE